MSRSFNSDGFVEIRCSICGKVICRSSDMGFSTAKCVECQKENPVEESKPLEVLEAEGKLPRVADAITEKVIETTEAIIRKVRAVRKKKVAAQRSKLNLKKEM